MPASANFDIIDGVHGRGIGLRADGHPQSRAGQVAGPFEVAPEASKGSGMRDVLITGLLVIYPAFATVAAIVVGLFLAGAGGA